MIHFPPNGKDVRRPTALLFQTTHPKTQAASLSEEENLFHDPSIEDDERDTEEEIREETDDDHDHDHDNEEITDGWRKYRQCDSNLLRFSFTVQNNGFQIPIQNQPGDKLGYF